VATEPATGREGSLWSTTGAGERRLARRRVSRCLASQPVQPQGARAPFAGRWARPQRKDPRGDPLLPIDQISVKDLHHVAIVASQQTSAKGDLREPKTCQHPGSQPKDSSNGRSITSTKPHPKVSIRGRFDANSSLPTVRCQQTALNRNAPAPTGPPQAARRRCRGRSGGSPNPPDSPAGPAAPPPATPLAGSGQTRRSGRRRRAPAGG